jgi:proteasome assembly chaperone (PAC2) family protein
MVDVRRSDRPDLDRPALIAAFEGWNDAGQAASTAVGVLSREVDAASFAEIDAEEFVDYQVTRPLIRTDDDGGRRVDWPELRLSWASLPGAERDVVLLQGPEPNLRWRTFTRTVTELAEELGVGLVVTVGALQVDAPHSRPVPVTGTATDAELGARLTLRRSGYEGPTGITGVLHAAAVDTGFDAVSLWAGVPHYLAATTYLPGAHALAERAGRLLGVCFS